MRRLIALIWYRLGLWLDGRGLNAVASSCYTLAGRKGGKSGALALGRLGNYLLEREKFQDALATFGQATHHDADNADAWCGLGTAFRRLAQFDEARRCFDRALEIAPGHLQALTHAGELLQSQKQPEAALAYFDRALEQAPHFYSALARRIDVLAECGKFGEAEQAARQALEIFPDSADLHEKLGTVLLSAGQQRLALFEFQQALEIQPNHLDAQLSLANLAGEQATLGRLEDYIREKIDHLGESVFLLESLAMALLANNKVTEAEELCLRLTGQHPESERGWRAYAFSAIARGDPGEALTYLERAKELVQQDVYLDSNILFTAAYLADVGPADLFKRHQAWAEVYEAPLTENRFSHPIGGDPDKRLRIGYISSDLGNHPVGDLLRGVLLQHDHGKFEIHCFLTLDASDFITDQLRANCDVWHDAPWATIDELAALIQKAGIDILIDLSGHTRGHRLSVFALKPAPVQATWIGYFNSTGMNSIDYFITDPYTTPLDSCQFFSELPARLPHSRFCFTPREQSPEVSSPPFEGSGFVTFGSFNRLAKLTDEVLDAWSMVLSRAPGAQLLIKDRAISDAGTANRLRSKFESRGISADRLLLRPESGYLAMLGEYSDVDIALDPFPFNGGMTSLLALWMGVPVIALAGDTVVSRQSVSLLSNIGHEELVFPNVESYVDGAVALAHDRTRLAQLRQHIRPQMSRSPLCDAEQFTSDLETLYRHMWRAQCHGEKLGPEIIPGPPVTRKILARDNPGVDYQLEQLFQRRWQNVSAPDQFAAPAEPSGTAQNKIEVVSATRLSESEFWTKSALGISLRRLSADTRLVPWIAFENRRGLPDLYNSRIESDDNCDTLIFVHDDVWIDDQFLADHVIDGLKSFDVVGVAGNRRRLADQPAWCFVDDSFQPDTATSLSGRVAHDRHPFGGISVFGGVPAECELLDGLFLAARKSRLRAANIRFDPNFEFHFYDMDFCRTAKANGLRLGTWAISVTHQSTGAFGSQEWKAKHRLYQQKWGA